MKSRFYTLLYIGAFVGYFTGCASGIAVRNKMETAVHSDSLLNERRDSLFFRQLQQREWAMNMRLKHLSFSSPDSSGHQYVENATYIESDGIKKENISVLVLEEYQAKTQTGSEKTKQVSEATKEGKGGIGAIWRDVLISVLFFLSLLTVGLPAFKRMYDKIVSK